MIGATVCPMTPRVLALSLSAVLLLSACGGDSESTTASSSPSDEPSVPSNCLEVSKELGDAIAAGGEKLTWIRGQAVKSAEHTEAYYIAGLFKDGRLGDAEELTGVWASGSLKHGDSVIISVDGFADEFTNWPKSNENTGSMTVADKGATDAKACLKATS